MIITKGYLNKLTYEIVGSAIEVHKSMGPGLLESVYEKCMAHELNLRGICFTLQKVINSNYKGLILDTDLRFDMLIEDLIIVEIKSIEDLAPIHEAKLLTYMRLLERPKGILINFNCVNIFKEGQRTFVNEYYAALPE